jgi:glycosyltransferase involved in cell wall biosynthesis
MRFVYHHRTHRSHGAEAVHIRGLVIALREKGHEVEVVSPPGCDPFAEQGQGKPQSAKHPLWRFTTTYSPQIVFELLEIAYNLYAFLRLAGVQRPDVIYERYFVFSMAAGLIARLRRCQVVYEVNDSSYLTHRVRGMTLVGLARSIERRVLRRADIVVVISRAMADIMVRDLGVEPGKVLILPNAVHQSTVAERAPAPSASADGVVIGCVGFFVPWHGLELLVEAVAELRRTAPQVRLLLIGDGPVRPDVERRAAELGVTDLLTITGTVRHEEVRGWLNRVDIAVLADSNDYGSPMKIFEYMAAAKPIVAPDYGPVVEVLEHGSTGMIFQRRTVSALAGALEQLVRNQPLRQQLGENARQAVLREHTWTRNAEKLEQALSASG